MLLDASLSDPEKANYHEIRSCRMCGGFDLAVVLDLGDQYLTGVFPRDRGAHLTSGPLKLGHCSSCGLTQLMHSFEAAELYGDNYGYRSSLNSSMVKHLCSTAAMLDSIASPTFGDIVLDIGSNDGTLLGCYPRRGQTFVGFDPSAERFQKYYAEDVLAVPSFFSAEEYRKIAGARKAKLITSIAMFYDLERPLDFVQQVVETLADDGVWFLEQSYLPAMLEVTAYDTVCHEHLEYYGLAQIKWLADRAGLKIINVTRNAVNGGSFAITLSKARAPYAEAASDLAALLGYENELDLNSLEPFARFRERVARHREQLRTALAALQREGKMVLGYGASTKGNVLLQYCEIGPTELPAIAEVNQDKFGCFTPGMWIPIVSEAEARKMCPDCYLVLPWHFRDNILGREQAFLRNGGRLLFPLPSVETVATCAEQSL